MRDVKVMRLHTAAQQTLLAQPNVVREQSAFQTVVGVPSLSGREMDLVTSKCFLPERMRSVSLKLFGLTRNRFLAARHSHAARQWAQTGIFVSPPYGKVTR